MRYRKQDIQADYSFGADLNNFYIDCTEAVAQSIETRLKLWVGEWFANTSEGTGWSQAILGKQSKNLYELTLRQRVLETYGVTSIESFQSQLNPQTRTLSVSMGVNTVYGHTTISGVYE